MLAAHIGEALSNSGYRIVVTGSGGWLGLATLDLLQIALGPRFRDLVHCFGSQSRDLALADGTSIEQRPLSEIEQLEPRPTLVLHLAFLTKDRAESMDEEEYRAANRGLSDLVLNALDKIGAEAVFVASSGAARSAQEPAASPSMRLYGMLKLADEEAFAAWAQARGKRAVIARIFNISGPRMNKPDIYALACFIVDALAKRPIHVRAGHPVVRGYVAIRELMSLVFALMLDEGPAVVRFDSGGTPMELGEVAQIVSTSIGNGSVERTQMDAGSVDSYVGDYEDYRRLLAGKGIEPVSFPAQVAETAAFFRQSARNLG